MTELTLTRDQWERVLEATDYMAGGSDETAEVYDRLVGADLDSAGGVIRITVARRSTL